MAEIESITEAQWAEYLDRLTLYATRLFTGLGWRGKRGSFAGPGGVAPQDLAHEAILKVLDGKRNYDPLTCPSFMAFLRNVVKSLVSHIVRSAERRLKVPVPQVQLDDEDCAGDVEFPGDEPTPLQNCISQEVVARMRAAVADDGLAIGILDCMDAEITKPSEIAEVLGVEISTVNNAQKRLRRKVEKALAEPAAEGER